MGDLYLVYLYNMVIFHSYVSLPEGTGCPVDSVQLPYQWLNSMVYGRYNELVYGAYELPSGKLT